MDAQTQEDRRATTISAAVSFDEREAIHLAVRIDKLTSVSEALRSQTVTQLIERGRTLLAQLEQLSAHAG